MAKKIEEYIGTGRRKTAVASVRIRPGNGKIEVNSKVFKDYFPLKTQQDYILAPLKLLELDGQSDMVITVKGGGPEGQAGAVRLGIARALEEQDEARRQPLKAEGFLTRDPRKKERKKYGQPGARKRSQFSKR